MENPHARPAGVRLARAALLAWRRHRRNRERGCVRCGAPAGGACIACQARVCASCSVVSIETGTPVALCLGCSAGRPSTPRIVRRPAWHLFRRGASLLLLGIAAIFALTLARDGWAAAWRVVLLLVHPSILFAFVPLALVLGAAVTVVRKLFGEDPDSAR